MAIVKVTRFGHLVVKADGQMEVHFLKGVEEDGVMWPDPSIHTVPLNPTSDPDIALAGVSRALEQEGFAPIDVESVERVKSLCLVCHTPKVVAQYKVGQIQSRLASYNNLSPGTQRDELTRLASEEMLEAQSELAAAELGQ